VVITSMVPNTKMKLKKRSDKQWRSVTHSKDFFFYIVSVAVPEVDWERISFKISLTYTLQFSDFQPVCFRATMTM
jgi:hypothetical protein